VRTSEGPAPEDAGPIITDTSPDQEAESSVRVTHRADRWRDWRARRRVSRELDELCGIVRPHRDLYAEYADFWRESGMSSGVRQRELAGGAAVRP